MSPYFLLKLPNFLLKFVKKKIIDQRKWSNANQGKYKETTSSHIIVILLKTKQNKIKHQVLKEARERQQQEQNNTFYTRKNNVMNEWFLIRNMETRNHYYDLFK